MNPHSAQGHLSLTSTSPASAMAEFEQILLSNSGEDAFESAIKLLAAKLVDELEPEPDGSKQFRVHESPNQTLLRVQDLYQKAVKKWPQLNGSSDDLGITPPHLVRSIRPLLGWSLQGSDLSWLDATLERLVARDSKGELGQYFTPRDVVSLCVEVLNPNPDELLLDPACGSGGFLFESVRHSVANHGVGPKCLGIDFSSKSVKVAALLAAAMSGHNILISKANSLDGRSYSTATPPEWMDFLCQASSSSTRRASTWGDWNRLGCNVLITNPPFAGDIDELDLLDAYEAQQKRFSRKAIGREHLFLERAINLLLPGGRLAIVLPQGVLANQTSAYLRAWMLQKCRILGVIGLHQFAFLPYTGVKTALLFLEKPLVGETIPKDYPVFFATSHSAGKDSSGRTYGESDYSEIANNFRSFLAAQGFPWAFSKGQPVLSKSTVEGVSIEEISITGRFDAEHFDPEARVLERKLTRLSNYRVSNVVRPRILRFKKDNYAEINYLDISSVDQRTGLTFPNTIPATEAPSRASYLVEQGDVLVSTVRPDRNAVALVTADHEKPIVASNGFCVLRATEIAPELLFAFCKTTAFKKILSMHSTASMYPTVSDKDVLNVPFICPSKDTMDKVVDLIRSAQLMIEKANRQIREAVSIMDDFIIDMPEQSE